MAMTGKANAGDLRLLIVESDPALRGILTSLLGRTSGLEVVGALGHPTEALEFDVTAVDVALLDCRPSASSPSSTQLAIELKLRRPQLGAVVLVEETFTDPVVEVPPNARRGWAFLEKGDDFDVVRLSRAILAASWGLNVYDPGIARGMSERIGTPLDELTERQRQIIRLAASGMDAAAIAEALDLRQVAVRQELSRIYAVLVPDPKPGTDLRTLAVIRYLRYAQGG